MGELVTAFQLSLPGFEGPVEALQPMVSARQLPLEELPLAAIPAQFLAQTSNDAPIDLELAGEVLSAVSRLMLLKSVHLLAVPEPEEEEQRVNRVAGAELPTLRAAAAELARRPEYRVYPTAGNQELVPRNTEPRPIRLLTETWSHLRSREGRGIVRAVVPTFVRMEEAVRRIVTRVQSGRRSLLSDLIGQGSRRDAVIYFLATLELVRTGKVRTEQNETFSEIVIEWADSDDRRQSRAG